MTRLMLLMAMMIITCPARSEVTIGSKTFTENIILGDIAQLALEEAGVVAHHRRQIGGSRILWEALIAGDIDIYPDYTGTIRFELLAGELIAGEADVKKALASRGLAMTAPLGFNNTYAMGMKRESARQRGITRISDLNRYPELRLGFSNEFMDRSDGWPRLRARYGLPQDFVRGVDHDIAYRGLVDDALDVIDLYTTDAEIAVYDLVALEDDQGVFPDYQAVYLYRLDLAPQAIAALQALTARIDANAMIAMNRAVRFDGHSEQRVAAQFVAKQTGSVIEATAPHRWQRLWQTSLDHLGLVALSLSLAILIALPLGLIAARQARLGAWLMGAVGVMQTIPALALFVFMIPLLGIGAAPAIAALFFYSLLPIVRNTHAGLSGIAPSLLASADVIGLTRRARLWRIELPLALPTILAGVKTAAVINVGAATLGALIGAGGYGQPILTGIRLNDIGLILEGAVPAALMALLAQALFDRLEIWLSPRGLKLRQEREDEE